jgi:hypothetical protein
MTQQQADGEGTAGVDMGKSPDDTGMSMPPELSGDEASAIEQAPNGRRISQFMKRPSVGASIAGAVVLGAAAGFGVLEAAVGAGAAYAAYRLLRGRGSSNEGEEGVQEEIKENGQ